MTTRLLRRVLFFAPVLLAAPLLLIAILQFFGPQRVDIGPADRDYVQGLHSEWRIHSGTTWREMGRRARIHLPLWLDGPGSLILSIAQPLPIPVDLQVRFDDGTSRQIRLDPSRNFQKVVLELPQAKVRADVRLRTDTDTGAAGRLWIDEVQWQAERARPRWTLVRDAALLLGLTFATFALAGASLSVSLIGSLGLATALLIVGGFDPFACLHLIRRGAFVAPIGFVVVGVARSLLPKWKPAFLILVFVTLLLKSFLVFHPAFYFTDHPIHETLLELVYHRGVVDFWLRLPDYQVTHNLGVAPAGGVRQPYPYPVLFYLAAHMGNRLYHNPEIWLKATAALVSTLVLFPIGAIARRLLPDSRADLAAGIVYLFTPALTRSLLFMEYSALTGHLFDLLVIAYLAHIAFDFDSWKKTSATALLIAASAVAYTSGFIHQGLLVGSCLLLTPLTRGLSRRNAFRLAAAGLAGAALAVVLYHPRTVVSLLTALFSGGIDSTPETVPLVAERAGSAVARLLEFLGFALPWLGIFAVGYTLRQTTSPPLRHLVSAWTLSGAIAFGLRFIVLELMTYQKELYWVGALLAVASGFLIARTTTMRYGYALAGIVMACIIAAGIYQFVWMAPRFYWNYLFLH